METNSALLEKAILFAAKKHKGVIRKATGHPYIMHPMAVMLILTTLKDSNNPYLIAIVAMLHDVVEDCEVKISAIRKLFGDEVADLVEELTTDKAACKAIGKTNYLKAKMLAMSSYALRIKLADRLNNCEDLAKFKKEDREKRITETLEIIKALELQRELTQSHKILIKRIMEAIKPS